MSGVGARVLGVRRGTTSTDLGDGLFTDNLLRVIGLEGTCGFQCIFGIPNGMYTRCGLTNRTTPIALMAFLRINNIRVPGNVYGQRPFAYLPTTKTLNDVYEPRSVVHVSAKRPWTVSSIGIDLEDLDGTPVCGDYTAVLRLT